MRVILSFVFVVLLASISSAFAENTIVVWTEGSNVDSLLSPSEVTPDEESDQGSVETRYLSLLSFDDLASYLGSETPLIEDDTVEVAAQESALVADSVPVEIPLDFVKDATDEEIRNYKPPNESMQKVIDAGLELKNVSSVTEIVAASDSELLGGSGGKSVDNGLWISRNKDGSLNTTTTNMANAMPLKSSPLTASVDGIRVDRSSGVGGLTVAKPRTASDFDPFKVLIRWEWSGLTVGEAVHRIGSFVGYNVVVSDRNAERVYALPLPGSHRVVSGINAQTGLEILAGPAFTVVVNHTDRTISHRLKPSFVRSAPIELPPCPDDATFATHAGIGVWSVGGLKCSYQ